MKYLMTQCDECCENALSDDAIGWTEPNHGIDLCPRCSDARALEAEHDLEFGRERCEICGTTDTYTDPDGREFGIGWDPLPGRVTCYPCGALARGYDPGDEGVLP